MSNSKHFQSKARELARSGKFYGWPPIAFVLQFEDGFEEAREWLHRPETREKLDRLCQQARHRISSSRHEAA
jgi:hypothetical protein